MNLFILLFFVLFSIFTGKPAPKTEVYLEKGAQKEVVAFQLTGTKGKVTFKHLDAASYRLLLLFPQQEGKYLKEKPKHQTMTKATYNPKNKTYYYQGTQGYFSIHFSGIKKIKGENFKAVYKEDRDDDESYAIIAEFGANNDGASISLLIKAITAAQFKNAAEKIGQDISTMSIRGIK